MLHANVITIGLTLSVLTPIYVYKWMTSTNTRVTTKITKYMVGYALTYRSDSGRSHLVMSFEPEVPSSKT
ncbi:hypothetical protein RJ639_005682 [Escallonia herrerae]|uniref:Uncharacterized protein n=1 Tax=Escallonia herrerae TaxID=1293975 RepID=A0AA88VXV8_9ASTE|nr:hypothetical protein RJ639_005682 [Escallonia herrerae]